MIDPRNHIYSTYYVLHQCVEDGILFLGGGGIDLHILCSKVQCNPGNGVHLWLIVKQQSERTIGATPVVFLLNGHNTRRESPQQRGLRLPQVRRA